MLAMLSGALDGSSGGLLPARCAEWSAAAGMCNPPAYPFERGRVIPPG
jgi:hypothetical protein